MPNPFRRPPARLLCADCGLSYPTRRVTRPDGPPPFRCLCCAFLLTIGDAGTREAVRRLLARSEPQRRLGGRDAPPAV